MAKKNPKWMVDMPLIFERSRGRHVEVVDKDQGTNRRRIERLLDKRRVLDETREVWDET